MAGPLAISLVLVPFRDSFANTDAALILVLVIVAVAAGRSSRALIDEVSRQLTRVLGLHTCRFQYGVAGLGRPARLRDDGEVEWQSTVWDVERTGLPTGVDIELLVESGGRLQGRFLLTARPDAHPSTAQRLVAVTLAAQVGASLR